MTNILFRAFCTSDAINNIFGLAIDHRVDFLDKISFGRLNNFSFNNKWTNWTIHALFHSFKKRIFKDIVLKGGSRERAEREQRDSREGIEKKQRERESKERAKRE